MSEAKQSAIVPKTMSSSLKTHKCGWRCGWRGGEDATDVFPVLETVVDTVNVTQYLLSKSLQVYNNCESERVGGNDRKRERQTR